MKGSSFNICNRTTNIHIYIFIPYFFYSSCFEIILYVSVKCTAKYVEVFYALYTNDYIKRTDNSILFFYLFVQPHLKITEVDLLN